MGLEDVIFFSLTCYYWPRACRASLETLHIQGKLTKPVGIVGIVSGAVVSL
jgi:hypothetical protein